MEKIFYCSKCNSAYGGNPELVHYCPDCKNKLVNTAFERDEWRKLSNIEKNKLKAKWKVLAAELEQKEMDQVRFQKQQQEDYANRLNNHMLTSGFNFEGYRIIKYLDVVSAETVLGTGMFSTLNASFSDIFGEESSSYGKKLKEARNSAKKKAIYESTVLGGNALIGIDIDYVTFTADLIGVVYTGTSVVIEKLGYGE